MFIKFYKDDIEAFKAFMEHGGALCSGDDGYYHSCSALEIESILNGQTTVKDVTIHALEQICGKWSVDFCEEMVAWYRTEVFDIGSICVCKFQTVEQARLHIVNMAMQGWID